MAENGLKISVEESYSLGTSDFSQSSEQLRSNRIDAFYVAGPSSEAARIVRQSRQVGLAAQLISGSILGATEFNRISGGTADGTLMISSIDPRLLPEAKTVVETFKKNGFEPEGYTLYAYAAVQSWAQAVQSAGTDEPARVADALHKIGSVDTVAGRIAFDERGDVRNPRMGVYQFRDGGFRLVEEIKF